MKEKTLKSSRFWISESNSLEEFIKTMDTSDVNIPIDSNVLVFIGNKSESLEIFDLYRPQAGASIRYDLFNLL